MRIRKGMSYGLWTLNALSLGFIAPAAMAAPTDAAPLPTTAYTKTSGDNPSDAKGSLSIRWDATLASKYLWHGIDYNDGHPAVQPEAVLAYDAYSATLWLNYDLHTHTPNEVDLYLQYAREIKNLSLTLGYAHFNYPHRKGWGPSQEVSISLALKTAFNPILSFHEDYASGKGTYAELGLSQRIEHPLGALSFATNLYYHDSYYDLTGFPSLEFQGSNSYAAGSVSITPSLAYFLTWNNGDFTGGNAVPDAWLFSLNIAQKF